MYDINWLHPSTTAPNTILLKQWIENITQSWCVLALVITEITWTRERMTGGSEIHTFRGSTWMQHLSRLRSSAEWGACAVDGGLGVSERLVGRESHPQPLNPGASAWTMNRRTWKEIIWNGDEVDACGVWRWWDRTPAVICGMCCGVNDL